MGRIYKVVLNSAFSNTPNYNTAFYYDLSQIPDQPYKVTFTYTADANTGAGSYITDSYVAMVYVDVGQGAYNSIASSPSNPNPAMAIYRSNFLGVLEAKTMSTAAASGYYSWLSADLTTNAPTYINTRPKNNNLVVEIHPNSNNLTGDYNSPTPANYVLTLCLEGDK
jgi:hypothetical protein